MTAIKNLIKAHKAQGIVKDTHTLKTLTAGGTTSAEMKVVGIETKYVPKFDANSPQWNGQAQGNGHRTRFILANGETVGTFSQGAHEFFKFFARIMGHDNIGDFLHIDITGELHVNVNVIQLDNNKSTYEFEIVEEQSVFSGLSEYAPNAQEILGLTQSASYAIEAPVEEPVEEKATAKKGAK